MTSLPSPPWGDLERARDLSAADRNVTVARDRDGQTPLHWSVKTDQLPLTSFWLEAGTAPATTDSAGQTALHLAAIKGLTAHLEILLAAKAPTDVRDTNGWTVLDAAIHASQTESIRLLLSDDTIAPRPERGISTTLHEAAMSGNIVVLAALTETETDLEPRNELGLTPLQLAVLHGHLAAGALLVDKGADVRARDPGGNTLLHQILLQDRQLIVHDRPPTNWLAPMGSDPRKETYQKYLTVGQYEQGPNPLLQAASFLLACGLEATATNRAGRTVVQLATDEKVTQRLLFFDAVYGGGLPVVNTLVSKDKSLACATNSHGIAVVEIVAGNDDAEMLKLLLSKGASAKFVNGRDGRTPLHAAAIHDSDSKRLLVRRISVGAGRILRPSHGQKNRGVCWFGCGVLFVGFCGPSAPACAPTPYARSCRQGTQAACWVAIPV